MEFQELLEKRRSIRSYDADSKPETEDIKELIQAALETPSWKNTETGRYHCVLSEDRIQKFRETCLPEFNQRNSEHAAILLRHMSTILPVFRCVTSSRIMKSATAGAAMIWGFRMRI